MPQWLLLIIAFCIGLLIDTFEDSQGMHAAALTLMAMIRAGWLQLISPQTGFEKLERPGIFQIDFVWYLRYALPLISIHHFAYFMIQAFDFTDFFQVLLKTLLSALISSVLVILFELMFNRKAA